jgi:hypothetical protein
MVSGLEEVTLSSFDCELTVEGFCDRIVNPFFSKGCV